MVGLGHYLLGVSCDILWWSRANKLGLSGYIILGLTGNYTMGQRVGIRLYLSMARWGEAKVELWSKIITVSRLIRG